MINAATIASDDLRDHKKRFESDSNRQKPHCRSSRSPKHHSQRCQSIATAAQHRRRHKRNNQHETGTKNTRTARRSYRCHFCSRGRVIHPSEAVDSVGGVVDMVGVKVDGFGMRWKWGVGGGHGLSWAWVGRCWSNRSNLGFAKNVPLTSTF